MKHRNNDLQVIVPNYLVKNIGRDYYIYGEILHVDRFNSTIIPKYVYYKNENIIKNVNKFEDGTLIKFDNNSFGFSIDKEMDLNIINQIEEFRIITDYVEKVEAIKSKYNKLKELRILSKQQNRNFISNKIRTLTIFTTILSFFVGLGFATFTDTQSQVSFFLLLAFIIFTEYRWITNYETRNNNYDNQIDKIYIDEEYNDIAILDRVNILQVYWKLKYPSYFIIYDKEDYNQWITEMKKENKIIEKKNFLKKIFKKMN